MDPLNRLLVTERSSQGSARTRVAEGTFGATDDHMLTYRLASRDGWGDDRPSHTLALTGRWSLTERHTLVYHLRDARGRQQGVLHLQGQVVSAAAHALTAAVQTRFHDQRERTSLLRLGGSWRTDARNRLVFMVDRARGSADPLTFHGAWELGSRQRIRYRFTWEDPVTQAVRHGTLTLNGVWDIGPTRRVVYRLDATGRSRLMFRAALQTPIVRPGRGTLRYQVGVHATAGGAATLRTLTLVGTWHVGRRLSVTWQRPVTGGRRQAQVFTATVRPSSRAAVALALRDRRGHPIGITVLLSRRLWRGARGWLRLHREGRERSLLGGVSVPW